MPNPPTASPNGPASFRGSLLLRICWLVLGLAFVTVFGVALFMVLWKGQDTQPNKGTPPLAANRGGAKDGEAASHDGTNSESPGADAEAGADDRLLHSEEVKRVLGHGFTAPPKEDSLAHLPSSPPPLGAPQPRRTEPPPANTAAQGEAKKPDAYNHPPLPSDKIASAEADTAIEKRLQLSEEEGRAQLLTVPEMRLIGDLEIQTFREMEKKEKSAAERVPQAQLEYAFNVRLHEALQQAGFRAGLPLMSGPKCRMDAATATIVQTLSKNLRDLGFVSVPGAAARGRPASTGATANANASPKEKIDALQEWCDVNQIEKFSGALAALLQMLQVEDVPARLLLVRELAKLPMPAATAALAQRAVVDLSPQVREAAVAALAKRPSGQYTAILLECLRYPWPPVADRAALALRRLKPAGALAYLVDLLDRPDPSLPRLDRRTRKPVVRELVRLNHMRNCLLCHAPSANDKDGLVRGLVPTPGQPLPRLYYSGQSGDFVRADTTFLRQDFSANLPVAAAAPWPKEQRFDFIARLRPAKPDEMAEIAAKPANYPQRDAVLYALRGLTAKDGGVSSAQWRELLGLAKKKEKSANLDKTEQVSPKKPAAGDKSQR